MHKLQPIAFTHAACRRAGVEPTSHPLGRQDELARIRGLGLRFGSKKSVAMHCCMPATPPQTEPAVFAAPEGSFALAHFSRPGALRRCMAVGWAPATALQVRARRYRMIQTTRVLPPSTTSTINPIAINVSADMGCLSAKDDDPQGALRGSPASVPVRVGRCQSKEGSMLFS